MSVSITYTVACGMCGGEAESTTLDLSNPQPDGSLRINLEMAAEQEEFECSRCGAQVFTGDLDVMTEGGQVPDTDDDDPGD